MDYAREFWVALGGTATALLIVGSLFTWIIQHRLSRQLERFKSELQQELSVHNFLYPERTAAIKNLYKLCVDTDFHGSGYIIARHFLGEERMEYQATRIKAESFRTALGMNLETLDKAIAENRLVFHESTLDTLRNLTAYYRNLVLVTEATKMQLDCVEFDASTAKFNSVEQAFKQLLGSDRM